MRFEVVQVEDGWSVCSDGLELAWFADQEAALADVSERMTLVANDAAVALLVRYRTRSD